MSTHRIFFSRLVLDAPIGILEHEQHRTQPLHIDAEIEVALTGHLDDQDIQSVLDYRKLRETLIHVGTHAHVNLLETLVERMTTRLMADFAEIRAVRLRISKPEAFEDCAAVGIEMTTQRRSAFKPKEI